MVGPNPTPLMDDYDEDCEPEDEYPEVGAAEDDSLSTYVRQPIYFLLAPNHQSLHNTFFLLAGSALAVKNRYLSVVTYL